MPGQSLPNDSAKFDEDESLECVIELRYEKSQFENFCSVANLNAIHSEPAISRVQSDLPEPSFVDKLRLRHLCAFRWNNMLVQFELF
jgi:hypothetical protein